MIIDSMSLLKWFEKEKRSFPWRETSDPFLILLAEIMLRKTTSTQVRNTYNSFTKKFSNPDQIIDANQEDIILALKPLGINRIRAIQIKEISMILKRDFNGKVPQEYDYLIKLPGVGKYIANAVLCFAFNLKVPIVDSNILRIYRRLTGTQLSEKMVYELLEVNLPEIEYREFNWALLDFAAKVCKVRNPDCHNCPINNTCITGFKAR